MQGFAAWKCGLFSCFDKVVSINGQHVAGMDLSEIKKLTIGNEGTVCTMVMRRGHDDGILFFLGVSLVEHMLWNFAMHRRYSLALKKRRPNPCRSLCCAPCAQSPGYLRQVRVDGFLYLAG